MREGGHERDQNHNVIRTKSQKGNLVAHFLFYDQFFYNGRKHLSAVRACDRDAYRRCSDRLDGACPDRCSQACVLKARDIARGLSGRDAASGRILVVPEGYADTGLYADGRQCAGKD